MEEITTGVTFGFVGWMMCIVMCAIILIVGGFFYLKRRRLNHLKDPRKDYYR